MDSPAAGAEAASSDAGPAQALYWRLWWSFQWFSPEKMNGWNLFENTPFKRRNIYKPPIFLINFCVSIR